MHRRLAWAFTLICAAALALLPALATACPACAARDDGNGLKTVYLLGSMILIPFGVAGVVLRIVRRLDSELSDTQPPEGPFR